MTLCQWGSVLIEEAKMSASMKAQQCLESACEKFNEAVSINPKFQVITLFSFLFLTLSSIYFSKRKSKYSI